MKPTSLDKRLSNVSQDFDYFLKSSIPPIQCEVDYIYDSYKEIYYCQFELLKTHYKCPYSGKSKKEAYEIACLHYLFTKETKCFPADPPIPFESYFNEYNNKSLICPFDEYKSNIVFKDTRRGDVEALAKLISELRDGDREIVSYSNDLVENNTKVTNRFGTVTLIPEQDISRCTNDEKKRILAKTAGEYLLSVEARLY